ncbi:MAG: hypothetical protein MRQ09_05430 [Candidatus Midichloria sp.]|nr:hypothetical protein [Candidatus Midichloria sp.]
MTLAKNEKHTDIIAKIEFKADALTVENEDRKYKNTTGNIDFTVTKDNGKSQKEVTGKAHFKTEALITEDEDHNNILDCPVVPTE